MRSKASTIQGAVIGLVVGGIVATAWSVGAVGGPSVESTLAAEDLDIPVLHRAELEGAELVSSYPDQARSEFEGGGYALSYESDAFNVYVGDRSDGSEVCLIVVYSPTSQAANCAPADYVARAGLIMMGQDHEDDPVEVIAVLPGGSSEVLIGGEPVEMVNNTVVGYSKPGDYRISFVLPSGQPVKQDLNAGPPTEEVLLQVDGE